MAGLGKHTLPRRMQIAEEVTRARAGNTPWDELEERFGRSRVSLWRYVTERQHLLHMKNRLTGHATTEAASAA